MPSVADTATLLARLQGAMPSAVYLAPQQQRQRQRERPAQGARAGLRGRGAPSLAAVAAAAAVIALGAGGCSSAGVDPGAGGERTVWRGVLEEALDLAAEDRAIGGPVVDRAAVRAEVAALAGLMRHGVVEQLERERARGAAAEPLETAEAVAEAVAAVLFGPRGIRGDPTDPEARSRELFDVDRVLLRRRGTCLAAVVLGLAAAEEAGLEVAPVLAPGHATLAVAPGFVVDPATGGVSRPRAGSRPSSAAELLGDLRANRSSYRRSAGDLEGALDDAQEAIELAPALATPRVNRACVLLDLKRPAEAVVDLEWVEAAGLGTATSAFNLAVATARVGQMGVAKHWYRVATERDPASLRAWVNRGALHAALGEPVAARAAFERALELDPQNRAARDHLERLR